MNNRLFVTNLSYAVTSDGLEQLFSEAGQVISAKIVFDRETRRSRGFGFVEMSTEAEAQEAIKLFHDKEVLGRIIRVNVARPLEDRQ